MLGWTCPTSNPSTADSHTLSVCLASAPLGLSFSLPLSPAHLQGGRGVRVPNLAQPLTQDSLGLLGDPRQLSCFRSHQGLPFDLTPHDSSFFLNSFYSPGWPGIHKRLTPPLPSSSRISDRCHLGSPSFFFLNITFIYLWVKVLHAMAHIWGVREQLEGVGSVLPSRGSWESIQVFRFRHQASTC